MTHIKIKKLPKIVLIVLAVLFLITSVNHSNSLAATSAISTTSPTTNKTVKPAQASTNPNVREQNTAKEEILSPDIAYPKSLFFTPEEISAIQRALLGVDTPDDDGKPKPPRILKLSGMIYNSPDNWVIWLNGKRITPDRLLPEIIDISVDGSKVHLKWFDYGINDVISITLRPHQIYDIETGILLPG